MTEERRWLRCEGRLRNERWIEMKTFEDQQGRRLFDICTFPLCRCVCVLALVYMSFSIRSQRYEDKPNVPRNTFRLPVGWVKCTSFCIACSLLVSLQRLRFTCQSCVAYKGLTFRKPQTVFQRRPLCASLPRSRSIVSAWILRVYLTVLDILPVRRAHFGVGKLLPVWHLQGRFSWVGRVANGSWCPSRLNKPVKTEEHGLQLPPKETFMGKLNGY